MWVVTKGLFRYQRVEPTQVRLGSSVALRCSALFELCERSSTLVVLQGAQDVWHLFYDKAPSLLYVLLRKHGITVEPYPPPAVRTPD